MAGILSRPFSIAIALALTMPMVDCDPALAGDRPQPDPYVVTIDVRPWIEKLRSDDLFQIDPAIESLGALGDHAVPALHAALKLEEEQARINIVEVLRDIRTPATVPPLVESAGDDSDEVRRDAIEALGKLGDPNAQPALESALDDPAPSVQHAAAKACLSLCSSPEALRRLVELTLDKRTAASARTSLSRVAAADEAKAAMIRSLVDEIVVPAMNDSGSSARFEAALIVAQSGNDAALPILSECVSGEKSPQKHPMMTVMCVQAMGRIDSDQSTAALAKLARSGDDRLLRPAACKELSRRVKKDPAARTAYAPCKAARAKKN